MPQRRELHPLRLRPVPSARFGTGPRRTGEHLHPALTLGAARLASKARLYARPSSSSSAVPRAAPAPATDAFPHRAPPRAGAGRHTRGRHPTTRDDEPASDELEEMRALEDAVLDPAAKPDPEVLRSVRALGTASPLRARLEDGSELLSGDEPVVISA